VLTGALALAAIAVHASSGWQPALVSLAVMAVLTLGGAVAYAAGGIGGGDVKLWIAASGMLSYPLCVPFFLYSLVGGGLLAIGFIIARGGVKKSFARAIAATTGGLSAVVRDKTQTIPYAIAFAFGAVAVALSQTALPFLRIIL
jgi:prepilin peptidase CpaA